MDILYVIFLSVFSLVVLFLLTKLIGYRQMSEMSMFDYISGITIGSIAAEMATALDGDVWQPLFFRTAYSYDCLWATNGFSCFYYGKKYEDTAFYFWFALYFV